MATNTINLSLSPVPSLRLLSPYSPQNAPNLSFYSHFRPPIQLPSTSHNTYRHTTATPRSLVIVTAVKNLSDAELVAVPLTAEEFNSKFPSETGVYAVYDKNDELQFVGISRNIAASVFSHLKSVPELCCSVKVCICLFYLFSLIIMISLQYLIERNNNFILILLKKKESDVFRVSLVLSFRKQFSCFYEWRNRKWKTAWTFKTILSCRKNIVDVTSFCEPYNLLCWWYRIHRCWR